MEVKLVLVPCKTGCTGCWYEDRDDCPVGYEYGKLEAMDFSPCFDKEQNRHMIFIPEDQKNEG